MTNPLVPATKLDAVNSMLSSIGQTPLNTLAVTGIRDAAIAELNLDNVTREVLNAGWSFNSDTCYELVPDGNDNIAIPVTALQIDPSDRLKDYVQRDNAGTLMFYDRDNHTFTITDNPLEVDVIWSLDFETIPQAARHYIATRASRLFQSQVIGSDILFKFTELHEREALALLHKMERRTKDLNVFRANNSENRIFTRRRRR